MLTVTVPVATALDTVSMFTALIRWVQREEEGAVPGRGMPREIASRCPGRRPSGSTVYVAWTAECMRSRSDARQDTDWEHSYPWYQVPPELFGVGVRLGGPLGLVLAHPTDGTPLPVELDHMGPRLRQTPLTV